MFQPGRQNNLDAMRLFFAIGVIFSHGFPITRGTSDTEPFFMLSKGQSTYGSLCVAGFFIISGYLISQSWERAPILSTYFNKRVRRIYPGFIVAMIVCLLLVVPIATGSFAALHDKIRLAKYLGQCALLRQIRVPRAFANNPIPDIVNGSIWTIQYEFLCYCLIAVFGMTGVLKRKTAILTLLILVALARLAQELFSVKIDLGVIEIVFGSTKEWPVLALFFLAGTMFYLYRQQIRYTRRGALFCLILIVVSTQILHTLNIVFALAGTYLILWIAYLPKTWLSAITSTGDYSYGIYLYAFPVQQLLMQFRIGAYPLSNALLTLPIAAALGFISWHCVEKHFLVRRRNTAPIRRPDGDQDESYGIERSRT